MAPPSQETITILALDKQQQPMFRVQFISGGFKLMGQILVHSLTQGHITV